MEELTAALQWVEGELEKCPGPFFMGQDLTLVSNQLATNNTHPPALYL